MFKNHWLATVALIAMSQFHASAAQAYSACISSNVALGAAIDYLWAHRPLDEDIDIRVRPGTYFWPSHPNSATNAMLLVNFETRLPTNSASYHFRLSGGWNAGCTQQALPGGPASIIDGANSRSPLVIRLERPGPNFTENPTGTITIDNIHFYRYADSAVSIQWSEASTTIHHARFSYGAGAAIRNFPNGGLFLHNSLFEQNINDPGISLVDVSSEENVVVANNTFRGNTLQGFPPQPTLAVGLVKLGERAGAPGVPGFATFENNIMRDNVFCEPTCGEVVTDINARLQNNIFSSRVLGTPLLISDNYNIDPSFAFVIGVVLRPNSLARDLGNNSTMAGISRDYEGRTRLQNAVVDIGAYELSPQPADALFANGYE